MRSQRSLTQRLWSLILVIASVIVLGTVGYRVIEGWPWHDALFMTVITLSTVGYSEVRELTVPGEQFTIVLILVGAGGLAYSFSTIADYIIAGELNGVMRRRRMERAIDRLNGHYVVCGFGRVGKQVVAGLQESRKEIVVIDNAEENQDALEASGVNYIIGDASDDAMLQQSGIERASGLCTCLPADADNVFIVLSARTINPRLRIIARCNVTENERKLRIAGANDVINPYYITGHRMAVQLLHPNVIEFLDVITRRGGLEMRIEEFEIGAQSALAGKNWMDTRIRNDTGVNVLAIRRASGQLITDLGQNVVIEAGDSLIGLGGEGQLEGLGRLAAAR